MQAAVAMVDDSRISHICFRADEQVAGFTQAQRVGVLHHRDDEPGLVEVDGKQDVPKYQRILNEFGIPYVVLHELDGEPDSDINEEIKTLIGGNRSVELSTRLEDACGHSGHFVARGIRPVPDVRRGSLHR